MGLKKNFFLNEKHFKKNRDTNVQFNTKVTHNGSELR